MIINLKLYQKLIGLILLIQFSGVLTFAQEYKSGPLEKDYVGYLFSYFKGNAVEDEAVCYAISLDGYNFKTLNLNQPVINSSEISLTGGVRDPHILRGHDGKTFYMVLTDMTSSKGWDSNRAMVLLKSNDLISWTHSNIHMQRRFKGHEDLKRVWAPQTIYDEFVGKYMVYWSMKHGDGPDIIYYSYANASFTDLETEPKPLFLPKNGKSCIDGDIINKNGLFYLFYKTEGSGNGLRLAITDSLTSGKWIEQPGYKQQTRDAVEGSSVFKLNHSDKYILMYDVYTKGRYEFCESVDLDRFELVDQKISMDFHPRHGSIIPLSRSELITMTNKWGKPDGIEIPAANNPALEGYYADPDIIYSQKHKKYFMYPTSDGFEGWGGYYFKTFSSENLREWKDEGVILDLKKDVSWADRHAWAPTITEKKIGNNYKYFYYFTAAQKIGVAVSDDPSGPFKDSGKPLIDFKPEGISGGQEIDPAVFNDPKSRKAYLYWGNGYLAVAELEKDMTNIKKNTIKVITPDSTFREGIFVIYRNNRYYYFWSEDDTRSENYSVRYGYAASPTDPIIIPANNKILQKDPSRGIYGTGHNSIIQVPGKDEWYIIYHRFSIPNGIKMGDAAGFHREVCIDPLHFDADGHILPVKPSL